MAVNIPNTLREQLLRALRTPEARDAFLTELDTAEQSGGGLATITEITSDATAPNSSNKDVLMVDVTSGTVTITLPTPIDGKELVIKHVAGDITANHITLSGVGSGDTTTTMSTTNAVKRLVGLSGNWWEI